MEYTKDKAYFFIETLRRCGFSATDIQSHLETGWPDEAMKLRQVQQLVKEFKEGSRTSFERNHGSGRPESDLRKQSIDIVSNLIEEDNNRTVRDIAHLTEIDKNMVHRIITEDIGRIWMHTKWVPHTLSENNKVVRIERCTDMIEAFDSRIVRDNMITIDEKFFYCRHLKPRHKIGSWVEAGGDVVQTARRTTMEVKFMAIVAISLRGQHYYEVLERNESIDSERYITFLKNMVTFFEDHPRGIQRQNMVIVQDNARPHTSRATTTHLTDNFIKLLKQPPYSPDTNLCDRYLFARLESLRTGNFADREDVVTFLDEQMPHFTGHRMIRALEELIVDLNKIVVNNGNYI